VPPFGIALKEGFQRRAVPRRVLRRNRVPADVLDTTRVSANRFKPNVGLCRLLGREAGSTPLEGQLG
jgi:hypothetical protein